MYYVLPTYYIHSVHTFKLILIKQVLNLYSKPTLNYDAQCLKQTTNQPKVTNQIKDRVRDSVARSISIKPISKIEAAYACIPTPTTLLYTVHPCNYCTSKSLFFHHCTAPTYQLGLFMNSSIYV